jgi:outer membrane protein OmpA-like peptidoglycan-associated protein
MTDSDVRRARNRLHPHDRAGLIGALLFPLALLGLWLAGLGPWDQSACRTVTSTNSRALHLDIESTEGRVTLFGAVASEADKKALAAAAEAQYGAANVIDRITVDASVPALAWADRAGDLMAGFKSVEPPARYSIHDDEITITGVAPDESAMVTHGRAAGAVLGPNARVANYMTVRKPPPPPVEVERNPEPSPPAAEPEPEPVAETPAEPPPPPAAPELVDGLMKRTLPSGAVIEIAPDGLETKVIGIIEDSSKPVDKNLWLDFDRLYFDFGSANLSAKSAAQIHTMTEILKAWPNTAIKIGGYTDNVGDPDFNFKLSSQRAERVAKEIIAKGVASSRIEFEGYGEQHPAADNATEEGRAKNRRTAVSVRRK